MWCQLKHALLLCSIQNQRHSPLFSHFHNPFRKGSSESLWYRFTKSHYTLYFLVLVVSCFCPTPPTPTPMWIIFLMTRGLRATLYCSCIIFPFEDSFEPSTQSSNQLKSELVPASKLDPAISFHFILAITDNSNWGIIYFIVFLLVCISLYIQWTNCLGVGSISEYPW